MKKIYLSILFSLVIPFATVNAANEELLDRIVAVVNDDVILQSELDMMIKLLSFEDSLKPQGQRDFQNVPTDEMKLIALRRLISRKLLLQAAGIGQIRLSEQDINQSIEQFYQTYKIDKAGLEARLTRFNISIREFRQHQELELQSSKTAQRMVWPLISVTQQEVDNHIASQITKGELRVRYNLALIYISIGDVSNQQAAAEKLQRAQQIKQQLAQGASFAQLAKQYSDHKSASRGGEMGSRKSTALPEVLQTALLRLQAGEISDIIHAADGYYIVLLHSSENSAKLTRDEVEQDLFRRKFYEQYNLLLIRLQNEAYIDIRI